jgi:hypothetical protein
MRALGRSTKSLRSSPLFSIEIARRFALIRHPDDLILTEIRTRGSVAATAIDVWAQLTPETMLTSPTYAPLIERARARERVLMAASPQKVVAAMDEAGVAKLFMCAWCLHEGWMTPNSQIVEIVRQFSDRFVGVASANLDDPEVSQPSRPCVKIQQYVGKLAAFEGVGKDIKSINVGGRSHR